MPRDVAYGSCGGQIDCIATYLEAHMTNTFIRAEPRAAPQLGAMNSDKDNKAGFKQVDLTGAKVTRQLSLAGARVDGALNASLLQDESALIRLWGLRRCRNRCPVICVNELSKRCKRERRDVRRPNSLRSAPALRSNGCSVGAIMASV
jgi:hypothetical protein